MEKILVPGGRLELNEIISDKTKKANTYLSQIYDIDEKVKLMYVIGDKIVGYITTQKLHYTNKGAYIKYFGRRIYTYEFAPVDFYGMEFVGGRK